MYRYLIYAIDKHQSRPQLRNDLPEWAVNNANDGFDVVVDLQENKRLFLGEWEDVDCVPNKR